LCQRTIRITGLTIFENMRMAANQFIGDRLNNGRKIKTTRFLSQTRMEDHLQQ